MPNSPQHSNCPQPLTPPDCDLRGFDWMPLYGGSFFSSSTYSAAALRNPRAGLAAVKLWWVSWHQVPAASLPNDDAELAFKADFGLDVAAWLECKDIALRGFVLCSDGRLYHTTLSKIACDKWQRRQRKSERSEAEAARLRAYRAKKRKENAYGPYSEEEPTQQEEDHAGLPEGTAGTREVHPAADQETTHNERTGKHTLERTAYATEYERENVSRDKRESERESERDILTPLLPLKSPLPVVPKGRRKTGSVAYPDWLPQDEWKNYEDSRKKLRRPMTDRARELCISKLEKLREQGQSPAVILQRSIENGWVGLFPLDCRPTTTPPTTASQRVNASVARIAQRHTRHD